MTWKRVCKVTDVPENTLKKFTVDKVTLLIANYGGGFRAIPPLVRICRSRWRNPVLSPTVR